MKEEDTPLRLHMVADMAPTWAVTTELVQSHFDALMPPEEDSQAAEDEEESQSSVEEGSPPILRVCI